MIKKLRGKRWVWIAVLCEAQHGVWAIHESIGKRGSYTVTHAPTGALIGTRPTLREAEALARRLPQRFGRNAKPGVPMDFTPRIRAAMRAEGLLP